MALEIIEVTGVAGGEAFLVASAKSAVLVDAGFIFSAPEMIGKIKQALGKRALAYILLTHAHYDHVGGVAALREAYPQAEVVGSANTAKTLTNPRALANILDLDNNMLRLLGLRNNKGSTFVPVLAADRVASEGETLFAEDLTIRVYETPGHTRGDLSYYFEEDGLLAASETLGIFIAEGELIPALIVSYVTTLESIEKLSGLHPSRVIVPHCGSIEGEKVGQYFAKAREAAGEAVQILRSGLAQKKSREEILADYKRVYWPGGRTDSEVVHQEKAFLLNYTALIPRVAQELGLDDPAGILKTIV